MDMAISRCSTPKDWQSLMAENSRTVLENSPVARAKSILAKSKIPAIRKLSVERDEIGVVLRGHVDLYYHKQLAQELVRNELDDIAIINRIQVAAYK